MTAGPTPSDAAADVALDAVRLAVADLDAAVAAYATLLGQGPVARAAARRFQLGRGAVVLVTGPPGLHSIRFTAGRPAVLPAAAHGIPLAVDPAPATPWPADPAAPVEAIDHVVVQTPDPERAIALWRDDIGLRLALDRTFEARGLRLLFFRSAGVTLEYAAVHPATGDRDGPDAFHGLSYRVRDLSAHRVRLLDAGFDVSEIRRGMRPGTSVATVRSRTAGVPTLLLQLDQPVAG